MGGLGRYLHQGRSTNPVWLSIVDDNAEFHDAAKIWGQGHGRDARSHHQGMKDAMAGLAIIGPAGENQVPMHA